MRVIVRRSITTTLAICLMLALSAVGQCAVVRVSTAGEDSPSHDGSTWALAKKTVQAGIDAAASGDEVWVAAGTYVQCVTMKAGVGLYGGFTGTETVRSQRGGILNVTILDGASSGSVVTVPPAATSTTLIDGFAIRNGYGTGIDTTFGGGIYSNGGSPIISNNTIGDNRAYGGGGIYSSGGSPTIRNNVISNNTAGYLGGGGIYCNGGTICNNTIVGNSSVGSLFAYGGGIICYGGTTVCNNFISGNTANSGGGVGGGTYGGGIYCSGGTIYNNTVVDNHAYSDGDGQASGGGIFGGVAVNNIVAFNSGGGLPTSGHNNCIYNNAPDTGGTDPRFVAPASGNYRLAAASPCIDAGDNSVVQPGWTDRDGNPRIFPTGGVVDMGCYESDQLWITIASPATSNVYSTNVSPLSISGTTTDSFGNVTGVTWSNNRGGSGSCTGAAAWSADGIVLQPGIDIITVTASDDLGNTADAALTVYYYSVPSTVTITSPTSEPTSTTTASAISLSGTAASDLGVVSVHWSNSRGGSGTCAGTTSWSVSGITLQPGDNVITITSTDTPGNSVSAIITVTRPLISIGAAKQLPPGSSAFVSAVVTATNIASGSVFVESPDRSAGTKLVTSQSLSVGQSVQLTGTTGRVNGECQISSVTFIDIVPAPPLTPLAPLGMTTRAIGNDLTEQLNYVGMNTTGLLIRYAGKVVIKSTAERFVYVDDGCSFEDGLSMWFLGIRVYIPADVTIPDKNSKVVVTGILRPEKHILPSGGGEVNGDWYPEGTVVYIPSIWIRYSTDITIL